MSVLWISIFASTGLSALLTWMAREVANARGLASGPDSGRHVHTSPIPRVGGVAIFCTFILGYPLYLLAASRGLVAGPANNDVIKVLLPAMALFVAGLVDDLRGIRPGTKLLVQAAGGLCLYLSGLKFACFSALFATSWINSALCLATTVFWVVLVCNAVNLIDGLDGLAAGAALFSMVTIFAVALAQGRTGVAVAVLILGGSIFGFLLFNFNPASIFLGDSGSLFVGFILSGLVLCESQRQQSLLDAISIPLISFALPLTDTALSVLRRFLSGHSLFGADREHIHHKLLELGLTHRQAVWILYGLSATFAVLGLFLIYDSDIILVPVGAAVLLILFFGVRKLGYQEFAEFGRLCGRLRHMKQSCARNVTLRKAAAELQRARDLSQVARLLEDSLKSDFDGFELSLDAQVIRAEGAEERWQRPLKRAWKNGCTEKAVFTLQLGTPKHRLFGQISCYRPVGEGWLADTDLLAGDFIKNLALALEHCVFNSPPPSLYVEEVGKQEVLYESASVDHSRHAAIFDRVSNLTALGNSAGD